MTFGAVVTNVPMRTYKVHIFKLGSDVGKHKTMKSTTIQNLRKNIIADLKNSRSVMHITVDSSTGRYVGNMMINPTTNEALWFGHGPADRPSRVIPSTGALKKL